MRDHQCLKNTTKSVTKESMAAAAERIVCIELGSAGSSQRAAKSTPSGTSGGFGGKEAVRVKSRGLRESIAMIGLADCGDFLNEPVNALVGKYGYLDAYQYTKDG